MIFLSLWACAKQPATTGPAPAEPASRNKETPQGRATQGSQQTQHHQPPRGASEVTSPAAKDGTANKPNDNPDFPTLQASLIAEALPNQYTIRLVWAGVPDNGTKFAIVKIEESGLPITLLTLPNQERVAPHGPHEYLDSSVKPNEHLRYVLVQHQTQTLLSEVSIQVPEDVFFKGITYLGKRPLGLKKHAPVSNPPGPAAIETLEGYVQENAPVLIRANRIFFDKNAEVYTLGTPTSIWANEIISHGGTLGNFPLEKDSLNRHITLWPHPSFSEEPGVLRVSADRAVGHLTLVLRGVDGKPGRTGRMGRPGDPGKSGLSYVGPTLCLLGHPTRAPTSGEPGCDGGPGENGQGGDNGGNSGSFWLQLKTASQFTTSVIEFPGLGGPGGLGGSGGRGGPGGISGVHPVQLTYHTSPGCCGKKGHDGLAGLAGQPGKKSGYCIEIDGQRVAGTCHLLYPTDLEYTSNPTQAQLTTTRTSMDFQKTPNLPSGHETENGEDR